MQNVITSDCVQVYVQVPRSLIKRVGKIAQKRGYSLEHALAITLAKSDIYQSIASEESKASYFGGISASFAQED